MANAKSGTLTPNVVTAVAITNGWPDGVEVINRTGTGQIWVRLDGVNPTVAGDDCYVVLGARRFDPPDGANRPWPLSVRLISTEALDYTVEGQPAWVKP